MHDERHGGPARHPAPEPRLEGRRPAELDDRARAVVTANERAACGELDIIEWQREVESLHAMTFERRAAKYAG